MVAAAAARLAGRRGGAGTPGVEAAADSHGAAADDLPLVRRLAGTAFAIRVAGAAVVYLSQVALARWMGASDFGLFVYAWTWVLLGGDLIHLGLASAAPRLIPQYRGHHRLDTLRGFLSASQWSVVGLASALALAVFAFVQGGAFGEGDARLLAALTCLCLPFYALANMLDGIARSFGWINSALLPPYVIRPLVLVGVTALVHAFGGTPSAAMVMSAAAAASVVAVAVQFYDVNGRIARTIAAGPRQYAPREWFATALPLFLVWSFYTLLTYTDILVLKAFRPTQDVALYFAATKTLALVAFIHFSVAAAVGHKVTELHVAGRQEALAELLARACAWTFWPSLAATLGVIALGKPILALFGPAFEAAYPLMFISALGLLARAAVGPAERLLSMLGQQRACAAIYAATFAVALLACLALVPWFGTTGAAVAMAMALVCESILLFWTIKRLTGLHALVWPTRARAGTSDTPGPVATLQAPPLAPAAPGLLSRAPEIRVFSSDDAAGVARLFQKTFGRRSGPPSQALQQTLIELFLNHPWHDPSLASRVYAGAAGDVRGFIGILPVRMMFRGQPIRAAAAGSLMVERPDQDPLAGARLLRAYFSGPQDLSFSETSNPLSQKMWEKQGGEAVPLYSMEWIRSFHVASTVAALGAQRWPLARALWPAARLADAAFEACSDAMARLEERGQSRSVPLDPHTFAIHAAALAERFSLRPAWSEDVLLWQVAQAARKRRYGDFIVQAVLGKGGKTIGVYAYHGAPRGVAVALQVLAAPGAEGAVVDHLFADARARGCVAVRGRTSPDLMNALLQRRCLVLHRSSLTMRSRNEDLLSAIRGGDALLLGLAGESWTRLIGDDLA